MKIRTVLLVVVLSVLGLAAQSQGKKGVIEVSGFAKISVTPDEVIFNLTVSTVNKDFSQALDQLNTQVNKLKKSLNNAGISESDVSTTNYDIREETKYESGKRVFVGFKATHSLQIKTVFNDNNLKEVYAAIKESGVESNMRMSFGLSSPEAYKNELMIQAVEDARMNANTLSEASKVELSGVKKIRYGQIQRVSPMRNYSEMQVRSVANDANISVNPGNLILSEKVEMVFYITNP